MAISPQYIGVPKSPSVVISTANTNRDGSTGTYGTLMTAGSSGSRVDRVRVSAQSTTTSGMIRVFLDSALIYEQPVVAVTPSGSIPSWSTDIVFENGLVLQASSVLKANTHNAESFVLTVISGGDF